MRHLEQLDLLSSSTSDRSMLGVLSPLELVELVAVMITLEAQVSSVPVKALEVQASLLVMAAMTALEARVFHTSPLVL